MSTESRRSGELADLEMERFFARQRREVLARIEAYEARRHRRRWVGAASAAAAAITVAVLGGAGFWGPGVPALSTAWVEQPLFAEPAAEVADPLAAFGAWTDEETAPDATEATESLGIMEWEEPLS